MDAYNFVTDIYLPDMLYAITIRSPVAKGKLISIDCPKLPENYRLVTAKDIPGKNSLDGLDLPVLAENKLSYIGEAAALLIGPDRKILEEYAKECKVNSKVIENKDIPVFSFNNISDDMIALKRNFQTGDADAAFANAKHIINSVYNTGIQEHWYAEPTGAVAWFESKTLNVSTATQWPFHVKNSVSLLLGLASSKINIVPADIGIHLDGKLWFPSLIASHAALGTFLTGKPVRLILAKSEDFAFSPKRCETEISFSSACTEEGDILGLKIRAAINLGAYGLYANEIIDSFYLGCLGAYKVNNIDFEAVGIKTNIPAQGSFCGFGLAQGNFGIEMHVSQICEKLNLNPAQWKKKNILTEKKLPSGLPLIETKKTDKLIDSVLKKQVSQICEKHNLDPAQWRKKNILTEKKNPDALSLNDRMSSALLIDSVLKMSDFERKWAAYSLLTNKFLRESIHKGIGLALGCQGTGLMYHDKNCANFGIEITLGKDGSLDINAGFASIADNFRKIWTGIAVDILKIDANKVRINYSQNIDAGPLIMSSYTIYLSDMIEKACLAIKEKRNKTPLPISVRKKYKIQKNQIWEEHFFSNTNKIFDCGSFTSLGRIAASVEVEIDPIEFIPNIRGVCICVDGGKIYNMEKALRSIKESAVYALSWAYREYVNYINGSIPADQFNNFKIIAPAQIPPICVDFIDNNNSEPKGISDLPFTCLPAAYLQAVSQAMDHHFLSIPLKPHDIWFSSLLKMKEIEKS